MLQFIHYPKCSTCKKAKNWLINNNIDFDDRDIVKNNPSYDELKLWINKSGLPIKKFFNTSGILYREMGLKDKLIDMNDDEKIKLLSSNGKMIKRPLIITDDNEIIIGFKEIEFKQKLL